MTYYMPCQCGNQVSVGDSSDNSIVVCNVCGAELIISGADASAYHRNKKRRRVGVYGMLGCLLLLGGGAAAVPVISLFSLRAWWNGSPDQVERELALVPAGEPLTPQELEQFYPTPPVESDPTPLWLAGSAPLESDTFVEMAGGLPLVGTGEENEIPPPGKEWVDLEAAEALLAHFEKELELLHRAAELGGAGRYSTQFQEGFLMELPHILPLYIAGNLLALEAEVMAHRENGHAAAEAIHAIFQLSDSLANEPDSTTQITRWAISRTGSIQIARLLPVVAFSSDDLTRMQTDVRANNYHDSCQRALFGERVRGLVTFENSSLAFDYERSQEYIRTRYGDQACYLGFMRRLISLSQQPWPAAIDEARRLDNEIAELSEQSAIHAIRRMVSLLLLPSVSTIVDYAAQHDAYRRCADTAISAKRYRDANGSWPESLEQLVPEFQPAAPVDPFTGKRLMYRLDENELVVYSVGEDGVDDGGVEETFGRPDLVLRLDLSASPPTRAGNRRSEPDAAQE